MKTKAHFKRHQDSFTLVEVMISAAIFVVALTGIFLAYGQSVRPSQLRAKESGK